LPSGGTVRPPRPHPPACPLTHFRELLGSYETDIPKGYKRRGIQPLAMCAHHQRSPTTNSEAATGSQGGDNFYFFSYLSFHFPLCLSGYIRVNVLSLLTCSVLWLCEIRYRVIVTFSKSISVSNPIVLKVMF